jgi:hypothetical protein
MTLEEVSVDTANVPGGSSCRRNVLPIGRIPIDSLG